jgi:primosomal protein N' (replication factor Y)
MNDLQSDDAQARAKRFAEVAVDAPLGPNRTFSYSIPGHLDLLPGHVVRVPFGPRTVQGIVVSIESQPQVDETRDVDSITNDIPVLNTTQLQLASWISRYYWCSLFEATVPMLPPGGRIRQRTYYLTTAATDGADLTQLTDFQRRILTYVGNHVRVAENRIMDVLGRGAQASLVRLADKGLVERTVGWAGSPLEHKKITYLKLASDYETKLTDVSGKAIRQIEAIEDFRSLTQLIAQAEVNKLYGAGAISALVKKGILERELVTVDRDPLAGKNFQVESAVTLTDDQESAAAEIRNNLDDVGGETKRYLLEGVTGSGKTEVYLDAVRHCIRIGKQAIVLVPEIALTPQTIERFASRFPGRVAVLHSGLSNGQKFDQWWKVRRGEYDVVIGSRGAVFAPVPGLGLIVIDEEHEWTYKQADPAPRYHARTVAFELARLSNAVVLLGGASPDVETYYHVTRGDIKLLRLPDRVTVDGAPDGSTTAVTDLASVEIVDMRDELRVGNRSMFSRALDQGLRDCIDAGNQAILFINRRGTASFLQCRSCGYTMKCRRCDVALTHHADIDRMVCHYCSDRRSPTNQCPNCLRYRMSYYGIGTEAVVKEVTEKYPEADVIRWDRDTTTKIGDYERLLRRFRDREAQVLVGTQMIAKGLHFPSVTLVGVVMADIGLGVPDHRAGEKAFQLLFQVAGRAGRGEAAGKAIIQTFQPENYAIQAAGAQNFEAFYQKELANRREQGNPPFSKLVRLVHTHTNQALSERETFEIAEELRLERDAWGYSDIQILGPTPTYPPRVRGHYRWQVFLRGVQPERLLQKYPVPPNRWTIDVDPVALG